MGAQTLEPKGKATYIYVFSSYIQLQCIWPYLIAIISKQFPKIWQHIEGRALHKAIGTVKNLVNVAKINSVIIFAMS